MSLPEYPSPVTAPPTPSSAGLRGHTKPKAASPLDQAEWRVWAARVAAAGSQLPMSPWWGTAGLSEGEERSGARIRPSLAARSLSQEGLPRPSPGPVPPHGAGAGVAWHGGAAQEPSAGHRRVATPTARAVGRPSWPHPQGWGPHTGASTFSSLSTFLGDTGMAIPSFGGLKGRLKEASITRPATGEPGEQGAVTKSAFMPSWGSRPSHTQVPAGGSRWPGQGCLHSYWSR